MPTLIQKLGTFKLVLLSIGAIGAYLLVAYDSFSVKAAGKEGTARPVAPIDESIAASIANNNANAAIAAGANTLGPVVPGVDLAALLTTAPRYLAWRKRRRFDEKSAIVEGVWQASQDGTNLTPTDREIVADICFQSSSVFETGVGESTQICTFTGVPRYTGVDNALEWLQNVMTTAPAHYRFHWADIGRIALYSHPTDPMSTTKWPLASLAALSAEDRPFDFYLVDGRFRVASFAASMLHALLRGKKDALFAMHDYHRREYVKGCEALGKLVRGHGKDHGADIAVFEMRPGLTADEIIAVWHEFKYELV